jgi:hypothetical protein
MTTVATNELSEAIQELNEACTAAIAGNEVDAFANLETYISNVESYVRETQQALWASEARDAIERLQKREPLTATDKEVIRAFLVSDAEHYVAIENSFPDWIAELKRLTAELTKRAGAIDRESVAEMRGVLKDAIRLVPDIRNYLDEKLRVEKFDNALKTLDGAACDMLARLMQEQLTSDTR